MSTFVHYLTDSSEERWQEVNLLIDQASDKEGVDKPLYNALCRAIVVLIVAHFEGFMKELARSIVQDINQFSTFNKRLSNNPVAGTLLANFVVELEVLGVEHGGLNEQEYICSNRKSTTTNQTLPN